MSLILEAGYSVGHQGGLFGMSLQESPGGSATFTTATAVRLCHTDISSLVSSDASDYTDTAAFIQAQLIANSPGNNTYTVTYTRDSATPFSVVCTTAAYKITFNTSVGHVFASNVLGLDSMSSLETAGVSTTADRAPYFFLRDSGIAGLESPSKPYEPRIAEAVETHGGGFCQQEHASHVERYDFGVPLVDGAITLSELSATSAPYTLQDFIGDVDVVHPFAVTVGGTTTAHSLRLEAHRFGPDVAVPEVAALTSLWNWSFQTYYYGAL